VVEGRKTTSALRYLEEAREDKRFLVVSAVRACGGGSVRQRTTRPEREGREMAYWPSSQNVPPRNSCLPRAGCCRNGGVPWCPTILALFLVLTCSLAPQSALHAGRPPVRARAIRPTAGTEIGERVAHVGHKEVRAAQQRDNRCRAAL